ncbi:hypothetical protein [Sphingomonas sp. MM-1]|uniref:hypothetical protein n=1 Tax=Sphingomonas sp. MM-1 TaxID=745310 RepID=UPI0005A44A8B|nr:hypothetical protein [Sphingomonas sp. MM-1]
MIVLLLSSLLATPAAEPSVCQKLAQDFDTNEYAMGVTHDFNQSLYDSTLEFAEKTGGRRAWADVREHKEKIERDDARHLETGSQITALMVAHKCQPPAHVTSWFTYSAKNPNKKRYIKPS